MRYWMAVKGLVLTLAAASCCPRPPGTGGDGNTTTSTGAGGCDGGTTSTMECKCDCPEGPPEPPQLDTFCLDAANEGAICCRTADGSETGVCHLHECVPPP